MDEETGVEEPNGIESILTGSGTEESGTQPAAGGDPSSEGATSGFSFGGRSYKDQAEAEASHNKLYGRFSDQQGTMNWLKNNLNNPDVQAAMQGSEGWDDIAAKLGIQQAQEDVERELENEPSMEGMHPQMQQFMDEQLTVKAEIGLDREMMGFEREMKRSLSAKEHDATMDMIAKAPSLSIREAYQLAHHAELLKAAHTKADKRIEAANPNRPKPTPHVGGVKLDTKKAPGDMSPNDFREALRADPDFQKMVNQR